MEEIAMNELDIADDVYPIDNISVKNKLLKMGIRDGFSYCSWLFSSFLLFGNLLKNAGLTAFQAF